MPYLPQPYRKFERDFPTINEAYGHLANLCHDAGPLDEKTRRLVKLGIALGLQSEGATKSQTRKALNAGATPSEVRHAGLLVPTTAGFPAMIAGMTWLEEVLEAQVAGVA